jgi:hypothetical protein
MTALVVADKTSEWCRLKALVLDSVSSPITRRVYNLGREFITWYTEAPRPAGFTKATARPPGNASRCVQETPLVKCAVTNVHVMLDGLRARTAGCAGGQQVAR